MKYSIFAALSATALLVVACDGHNKNADKPKENVALAEQNNSNDLRITQDIRKALADNKTLSLQAKNVQIATTDGNVQLAGNVESETEKRAVATVAQTVYGVNQVDNQIQVNSQSH